MAEVRASLMSKRLPNLETGEGRPFPGEPLEFETAIEIPSRLILSTAQDAVWLTNRLVRQSFCRTTKTSPRRGRSPPFLRRETGPPTLPSAARSPAISGRSGLIHPAILRVALRRFSRPAANRAWRFRPGDAYPPTALGGFRPGDAYRLPGQGAPPRGPYAPWFLGPSKWRAARYCQARPLEGTTMTKRVRPNSRASSISCGGSAVAWEFSGPAVRDYKIFRTSLDAFRRHQLVLLSSAMGFPSSASGS